MLCLLLRFACIFLFVNHITYTLMIRCQVLSIPHICPSDPIGEMRPRVGVVALLLGAAVADMVVEYDPWDRGVAISLGLALAHVCRCAGEGGKVVLHCLSVFFSWLGYMD